MDLHFLDGSAPELTSDLTHRGGYLFEERPQTMNYPTIAWDWDNLGEEISMEEFSD